MRRAVAGFVFDIKKSRCNSVVPRYELRRHLSIAIQAIITFPRCANFTGKEKHAANVSVGHLKKPNLDNCKYAIERMR